MPKGFYFFDTIIRQEPIDDETLDPEDNLEEFEPLGDDDLDDDRPRTSAAARATGRAVIASFGGTAFGDIALVPAPFLKHPKGIRDIAEWYMSLEQPPRLRAPICSPGRPRSRSANLERVHAGVGDAVDAVFLCGTDFGTQTSSVLLGGDVPRAVAALLQAGERLDPRAHDVEGVQALVRVGGAVLRVVHRGRLRHRQPGAVLGQRAWSRST